MVAVTSPVAALPVSFTWNATDRKWPLEMLTEALSFAVLGVGDGVTFGLGGPVEVGGAGAVTDGAGVVGAVADADGVGREVLCAVRRLADGDATGERPC